jgi:hypothetical protein
MRVLKRLSLLSNYFTAQQQQMFEQETNVDESS